MRVAKLEIKGHLGAALAHNFRDTKTLNSDDHALGASFLYGPKDPEIAELVSRLVTEHSLPISDVEALIKETLQNRLDEFIQ